MADGRATGFTAWGRAIDYLFGRNTLIGIASLMLLAISGYATWVGMSDFIIGVQAENAPDRARDIGVLSVTNEVLIAVVVITLTFLMWLALRETFGAQRTLRERLVTFPLYAFLLIWSVGFGYGFWWSLIAGAEATRTSLSALQEDARAAGASVSARLDAVQVQLDSVVSWSESQMEREETSGGSCGRSSGAGRGPLYDARASVRDSVASLRESIAQSWIVPVESDIDELRQSATGLSGETYAERQQVFEQRAAEVRANARSIANRSNELGSSYAAEMRALANVVSIEPGKPGFSCYDPTLAERLRQAAAQADEPVELNLHTAEFTEGPAGVANAIRNLWSNIGDYLAGLVAFIGSGFQPPQNGTSPDAPGGGITGRDLIALLAAIGVDLGLFALMLLNPPATGPTRRDALAPAQARLHMPTSTVVRQLTAALETAIARAPGADLEWVRRHFVHHRGTSYFVIPNLYSCKDDDRDEKLRALAMNQLAGVLDDLKLVVALTEKELRAFGEEEKRKSYSDLGPYRDEWRQESGGEKPEDIPPLQRNHGLLSKAERALDIAGWSQYAKRDVEIYKLVDTEGLTPLLVLLNEATLEKGAELAQAARAEYESENNRREEDRGTLQGETSGLIDHKPQD
ncbi:MAG: hypothetical protein ACLFU3_02580 [Dichotomicrobium sp.]